MAKKFIYPNPKYFRLLDAGPAEGRNLNFPADWDQSCDAIEAAGGIELTGDARGYLWGAICGFEAAAGLEIGASHPADIQRQVQKIRSTAEMLASLLSSPLETGKASPAWDLIRGHIENEEILHGLPSVVHQIDAACRLVLDQFDARFVQGGAGAPKSEAFGEFIGRLADIFAGMGGNVGYSTPSSGSGSKRYGPFIRFCEAAAKEVRANLIAGGDIGERVVTELKKRPG